MKRDLWTLDVNQSNLSEAKSIMEEKHIRHLTVVKGEKLVGMISLTDIHRISFGVNHKQAEQVDSAIFNSLKLEQVMKSDPTTINSNTTIKEVAETLAKEEFHALPIVDQSNKLECIFTTTDLVNYLIDLY